MAEDFAALQTALGACVGEENSDLLSIADPEAPSVAREGRETRAEGVRERKGRKRKGKILI